MAAQEALPRKQNMADQGNRELIIIPDPGTVSRNMGTCVEIHQEKTNAVHDTGNFIAERREDGDSGPPGGMHLLLTLLHGRWGKGQGRTCQGTKSPASLQQGKRL